MQRVNNASDHPTAGRTPSERKDTPPLVSVLLPAYNAGDYLQPAIESVLNQSHDNLELIIVDDGSTDGSVDRIRINDDPRVRVLRQRNRGKPAAMNLALAEARGQFYALQDADDWSHPDRLQRQVACLLDHPDVAGVFCGHDVILEGRTVAPTFRAKSTKDCAVDIQAGRMPGHDPTAMYRLSLVREFAYSEDLPVVEGVDYVLRVGESHPLMVLGECLYSYRVHGNSITLQNAERRIKLLEEAIARMRSRRGQSFTEADRERLRRKASRGTQDNDLVSHFCASVAELAATGQRAQALSAALVCWKRKSNDPYYFKPMIYALAPHILIRAFRRIRRSTKAQ